MSLDGIIGIEVLDCSFTAATFNNFIKGLLDQMSPWPQKNSVIIMDNASIHKSEELQQMIEDQYVHKKVALLMYLQNMLMACVLFFSLPTHLILIPLKKHSLPSRHGYERTEIMSLGS